MNDYLSRVEKVALAISKAAPKKRGQYVHKAGVPWSLIEELREELDNRGIVR